MLQYNSIFIYVFMVCTLIKHIELFIPSPYVSKCERIHVCYIFLLSARAVSSVKRNDGFKVSRSRYTEYVTAYGYMCKYMYLFIQACLLYLLISSSS